MDGEQVRRRVHSKVTAALRELEQVDLSAWRDSRSPELLTRGVQEFNHRLFFEQHETLEELWRAEPAPVRYLYQGILQVGVGFLHVERRNFHGAVVKLENGLSMLAAFEPTFMGLDVAGLRAQTRACLQTILELGPQRLDAFDRSMLPVIRSVSGWPPAV